MALGTATKVSTSIGKGVKHHTLTLALDSSYPTGGEAYDIQKEIRAVGGAVDSLETIMFVQAQVITTSTGAPSGHKAEYDYTAEKIVVFVAAGTEAPNATDLSALTVRLYVTTK